ncbi:MAG: hypothetical protein DRN49_01515 [Thaumarchaeota archaeon]|nr:MAG: hypothetical protein DRN49_01515 [Nitrososphaerota archaeon]
MKLLSPRERKFLENRLKSLYGVEKGFSDLVLIKCGRRRIRATTKETLELASKLKGVQQIGLYVMKVSNSDISLSVEGAQLLNGDIKNNIIELDEEQVERWMKAVPIKIETTYRGRYVIGKFNRLYLGSARVSRNGLLYPQIPKWRRIPLS